MDKDIKNFFQSTLFKTLLAMTGIITVLVAVFAAGMFVGYKKSEFSYEWAENYPRNFAGPQAAFLATGGNAPGTFFVHSAGGQNPNPYGIFASVLAVHGNTLVVKGGNQVEKTVVVSPQTDIEIGTEEGSASDLAADERIIVIGEPDGLGQMNAKLIRIFNP